MKLKMKEFYRFNQQQYKLQHYGRRMSDRRKRPQGAAGVVFLTLIYMVAWGKRHFLQMDQLARKKAAKRFFQSQRGMVCSDSTITRSLSTFAVKPVRDVGAQIYLSQKAAAMRLNVAGQGLRLGAIDGTAMGPFQASACLILGQEADLFLDAEPIPKRGKELAASTRLFKRLVKRLGPGFLDLLLWDGLYVAQDSINLVLNAGMDVGIKSDEAGLLIIQQANALCDHPEIAPGIEDVEGGDLKRQCSYQVWACGGFYHTGVAKPFWVARVREHYGKNKPNEQDHEFYVRVRRGGLSALGLRKIGHLRWRIENNGLRALNPLAHTKRVFPHDEQAFLAAFLIFFVAFNLIHLFAARISPDGLKQELGAIRVTLALICSELFQSLIAEEGPIDSS